MSKVQAIPAWEKLSDYEIEDWKCNLPENRVVLDRIKRVLAEIGLDCDDVAAYVMWTDYSDTQFAGWLECDTWYTDDYLREILFPRYLVLPGTDERHTDQVADA